MLSVSNIVPCCLSKKGGNKRWHRNLPARLHVCGACCPAKCILWQVTMCELEDAVVHPACSGSSSGESGGSPQATLRCIKDCRSMARPPEPPADETAAESARSGQERLCSLSHTGDGYKHSGDHHSTSPILPLHDQISAVAWPGVHFIWLPDLPVPPVQPRIYCCVDLALMPVL